MDLDSVGAPPDGRADRPRRSRRARRATSWGLHGAVIAGAVGAVVIDRRLRRRGWDPDRIPLVLMAGGFWGGLWALESRQPFRRAWAPARAEIATDAAFGASGLGSVLAAEVLSSPVKERLGDGVRARALPAPVAVAVAVLAFDLVHSRIHQLSHQWGAGWRLHSVHHSPRRLYWFNATRFHAGEVAVDAIAESVVLGVLGLSREQLLAYQTIRALYGQLQHANIDLESGPLDLVFSTPDLHRWHHSAVYEEGDSNYGAITSIWDHVFGTLHRPADREAPEDLGVGRMPDFPERYWELQRVPVDWADIRERNAATWS